MLHVLLGLFGGACLPAQTSANTRLRRSWGSPFLSSLISFAVGTTALLTAVLVVERGVRLPAGVWGEPAWIWCGGVIGVVFLTMNILMLPRLGAIQTSLFPVVGQVLMGLIVDAGGLFYAPQADATPLRLLGGTLVIGGAVMVAFAGRIPAGHILAAHDTQPHSPPRSPLRDLPEPHEIPTTRTHPADASHPVGGAHRADSSHPAGASRSTDRHPTNGARSSTGATHATPSGAAHATPSGAAHATPSGAAHATPSGAALKRALHRGTGSGTVTGAEAWAWRLGGIAVGMLTAAQSAINGHLGEVIGSALTAAMVNFSVGVLTLLIVNTVLRTHRFIPADRRERRGPWWMWVGGALGATYVAVNAALVPVLGTGATVVVVLLGNLTGSMLVDHVGLFATTRRRVTWRHITALSVVVAGVVLVRLVG